MPIYVVDITVGEVSAEDYADAEKKARRLLTSLAESNDGSEVLANADPELSLK